MSQSIDQRRVGQDQSFGPRRPRRPGRNPSKLTAQERREFSQLEELREGRTRAEIELGDSWNFGEASEFYLVGETKVFDACRNKFPLLAHRHRNDDTPTLYEAACKRYAHHINRRYGWPLKAKTLERKAGQWAAHAHGYPAHFTTHTCRYAGKRSGEARRAKSQPQRDKALAIVAQAKDSKKKPTCREIAEAISVHYSTVSRWLTAAKAEADAILLHEPSLETVSTAKVVSDSPGSCDEADEKAPTAEPKTTEEPETPSTTPATKPKVSEQAWEARSTSPEAILEAEYFLAADGTKVKYWLSPTRRHDPSSGEQSGSALERAKAEQMKAEIEELYAPPEALEGQHHHHRQNGSCNKILAPATSLSDVVDDPRSENSAVAVEQPDFFDDDATGDGYGYGFD